MIQRLLEQEKAITQVLAADKTTRHLVLTWQDVDVLDSVSKALGPLLEFTDSLSGEEYVSVSCLRPVLQLFNSDVLNAAENDTDLIKAIKSKILDYMNNKYKTPEVEDLINFATVLDPRFKTQHMENEEVLSFKARAFREMEASLAEQSISAPFESAVQDSTSAEMQNDAKRAKKSFGSFFKKTPNEKRGLSNREIIEAELSSYLQGPQADSESDPLMWWKLHEFNFPHVSKLGRKYLCIPATSAPSERVFSTGGNIVTCHRSALKPASVNMLVFLSKNLKLC